MTPANDNRTLSARPEERLSLTKARLEGWIEDAFVPLLVFILFALFARGLPWILGVMADEAHGVSIQRITTHG